jgi:hypothetical protein
MLGIGVKGATVGALSSATVGGAGDACVAEGGAIAVGADVDTELHPPSARHTKRSA